MHLKPRYNLQFIHDTPTAHIRSSARVITICKREWKIAIRIRPDKGCTIEIQEVKIFPKTHYSL